MKRREIEEREERRWYKREERIFEYEKREWRERR